MAVGIAPGIIVIDGSKKTMANHGVDFIGKAVIHIECPADFGAGKQGGTASFWDNPSLVLSRRGYF